MNIYIHEQNHNVNYFDYLIMNIVENKYFYWKLYLIVCDFVITFKKYKYESNWDKKKFDVIYKGVFKKKNL